MAATAPGIVAAFKEKKRVWSGKPEQQERIHCAPLMREKIFFRVSKLMAADISSARTVPNGHS